MESLWPSLHDAELLKFSTDITARSATFDLAIGYLGDETGAGSSFKIVLKVVRAICAARYEPWNCSGQPLTDPELYGKRDWGKFVSFELSDFEDADATILNASLHEVSQESVWPRVLGRERAECEILTVFVDSVARGYFSIAVVFETVEIFRDGQPIDLSEFKAIGTRYWETFSARNEPHP